MNCDNPMHPIDATSGMSSKIAQPTNYKNNNRGVRAKYLNISL